MTGTASDYARHRGCSRQYIAQLIRDGTIAVRHDGRIDFVEADRLLEQRAQAQADVRKAREARELVRLARERHELAALEARLVDAEEVRRAGRRSASRVRRSVMQVPRRLAHKLAAERNTRRAHALITAELRRTLERLATEKTS